MAFAPEHPGVREGCVALAFAFDELPIMQVSARLPVVGAGFGRTKPRAKMCSQGVEVTAQSVGRGSGDEVG